MRSLIFRPLFQDPDAPREIALFHDWKAREYIGVPRAWGLARFRGRVQLLDRTTRGGHVVEVSKLPDFDHPRVLDPVAQRTFYNGLVAGHERQRGFIAKAGTGTGKTVVSLREAGAVIKAPTIIMVHLERLMWQWYEEIQDKLGVDPSRIGIVQSDRCEWEGKDFAVGLIHSIAKRDYPREFYRHWGHTIYDEVHKVGSQFFAPVVYRFPAYHWLGLSATVERDDRGEMVFFHHLGTIAVTSNAAAAPCDVFPVRYVTKRKLTGRSITTRQRCLAEDPDRNAWLVGIILRMHRQGRQPLIVSYSVSHVQNLMEMCALAGIPREDMGQFTGQRHGGPYSVLSCEDNLGESATRLADGSIILEPGPRYSRLKLHNGKLVADLRPVRDEKGRVVIDCKKKDISGEELEHVKTSKRLVFATYGMIVEGIDEPRWDAGLDATPRGKATQLLGRIRRPVPGKPRAFWVTPFDERCSISKKLFYKRCGDYRTSGAIIKEIA